MPSFRQWEALVNCCSGVLSTSLFGNLVEFFMGFRAKSHVHGDAKQVAHALQGLFKISSGMMRSMVVVGNSECGFLAAFAHFFLSLRVVVQNSAGEVVYPSIDADTGDYQLMIIYTDPRIDSQSGTSSSNVYYIDHIKEVLEEVRGSENLTGKVSWEHALTQTFGRSAQKLLDAGSIFGNLLGSAARVYAIPEEQLPKTSWPVRPINHGPESSGPAFVDLACRVLP